MRSTTLMLIAQALGEYAATAALAEAFQTAYIHVGYVIDQWGTSALWIGGISAALWVAISRFK